MLNQEEIITRLKTVDLYPMEEYKGVNNKIKLKCLFCNDEFIDKPKSYLFGKRHICNSNRKIKSNNKKNIKYNNECYLNLINDYKNKISTKELSIKYNLKTFKIYDILNYHNIDVCVQSKNHNYFDIVDTEQKAYIFGFLMADGHNQIRPSGERTVRIRLNSKDIDILEKIKTELNYDKPIRSYISHKTLKSIAGKTYEYNFKESNLELSSIHLSKRLEEMGMVNNKSKILKFPSEEYLPKSLYKHFIRGYIDGDGCLFMGINKNVSIPYYQFNLSLISTKEFLEKISSIILEETGEINNKLIKHNTCDMYYLNYSGKRIKTILDWLYKDSVIHLDRKYKKYTDIIKKIT